MSVVIDASIVIAWAAPDEIDAAADDAMHQVRDQGGVVPSLWFLEVANILAMNERKNRLSSIEVTEIISDLKALPLTIDLETAPRAFTDSLDFARKYRLSVYDAAYLELAKRTNLPLATIDRELVRAARQENIKVITSIVET